MEPKFKQEIQQMMYIAGETQDVSVEALKVIEDIIRDQVVHMLKTANDLASRRGSRVFSNNDLIFQFRHDIARVERLRIFLTWKAIRKTVKDSDDKEGGLLDDADMEEGGGGGPAYDAPAAAAVKARFPTITLPWDVSSYFSEQVPETQEDMADVVSSEAALEKLRRNDERTRDMSVAEYATWSEYRHASLTYRKAKRFREWCGLGVVAENRPNDDVMDILGFLTSEMVQNLTAGALKVQMRELALVEGSGKETVENGHGGLFAEPEGVRRPVDVKHVRIAFQQLQGRPKKNRALLNGTKTPWSSELKLVGVVGCLLVKRYALIRLIALTDEWKEHDGFNLPELEMLGRTAVQMFSDSRHMRLCHDNAAIGNIDLIFSGLTRSLWSSS